MSQKNKQQLQQTNNSNFPNNNSAFITPEKLRDFNQDIIDSVALDVDTQLSGSVTLEGSLSASGDISGSSFYGDGSGLTGIVSQVPAGTVSGSSQIILTDTTGNLGGNRITGSVDTSISASHSETSDLALNANSADSVPFSGVTGKPTLVSGSSQISFNGITDKPTLVSGSSQVSFNGITDKPTLVSGSSQVSDITASLVNNATSDFSTMTFTKGDGTTFEVDVTPRRVVESVKNKNGFMPKGTPVYVSGSTGNELHVYAADAGNANRVPATFILDQDLDPEESGFGILSGFINGVDTSLFAEGANIYLGVGGGYTDVQPTGSAFVQKLGNVIKSDVNGSGVISGAGRVNALPNLTQNNVWLGDSNGVPQQVSKDSLGLALTGSNNSFDGTQTFNNITVNGTGSFAYIESVTGSAKIIGDAFIILNNDTPTERFAGIAVQDSGSAGVTASFQFDGQENNWFYEYSNDGGVTTDHGIALFGPEYSDINNPTYLTNNTIPKSDGGHHLVDSNITDTGTLVYVNSNFQALGDVDSISGLYNGINIGQLQTDFDTLNAKTLVSGSSQISYPDLSNIPGGIVSGSSQIDVTQTTNISTLATTGSNTFNGNQTFNVGNSVFDWQAVGANGNNFFTFHGASAIGYADSSLNNVAFVGLNVGFNTYDNNADVGFTKNLNAVTGDGDDRPGIYSYDFGNPTDVIALPKKTWDGNGEVEFKTQTRFAQTVNMDGPVTFHNSTIYNGGITINGRVQTQVATQPIVTNTATIDFNDTSLFVLNLDAGVQTTIDATNVGTGQTVNVLVKQNPTTAGTVAFSTKFLQPSGSEYVATTDLGGEDILTLMTYSDVNKIYVVATNKFQ